ncbi:MAG: hypothetical protein RLZ47_753 [Bacteroidota bacterium]
MAKKSAPPAEKKSALSKPKPPSNPGLIGDEDEEDFDLPLNDVDLDDLDSFDEDDDF